ncbi:DR2241 family protein [Halegenticoccus soli]|uniref:DR2241 family protein n=1 Tax=Halegenticoccus soli TaxID=1985678 RepID=UPI000C6E04B2|nr:DR2241 family protein [Halegenticoccus soli]
MATDAEVRPDLPARQFDALLDAANEGPGVQFDGLYVHRGAEDYDRLGGYTLGTPEEERTNLSESEFHAAAAARAEYVTNWYFWRHVVGGAERRGGVEGDAPRHHRRAFLRWVERADDGDQTVPERYAALAGGVSREWGQLRVTATLGPAGERRYELRHVDDADASLDDLDAFDDPLAARDVATYDEKGRYRPLKTAPTLRSGWVIRNLDQRAVVQAVDAFYPATIANWNLERAGELDVSHWDETAERQTGIYDVVDELSGDAVDRIAESCCVDSQCLKRRMWDENEETELGPERGEGIFPCREPCSLVIAAARKWTTLEREEPRTYEFELTPSEKEQLEEIVDAVADGRIDEIREADVYDGANRYRARYLRAKRFDEEGNLSGTPTEPDGADAGGGSGGDASESGEADGDEAEPAE